MDYKLENSAGNFRSCSGGIGMDLKSGREFSLGFDLRDPKTAETMSHLESVFGIPNSAPPLGVPKPFSGERKTNLRFDRSSDDRDLVSKIASELMDSRDPNLTKETLVLRALKRICEGTFNLSWSRALDTLRQGQCHFDREAHALLDRALGLGAHQHDEAVDRIASRDYVKKSDVDRLASLLAAGSDSFDRNVPVCTLFAVDGFYEFHDLKLYGNHFKCCEEFKRRHVSAVRTLYRTHGLDALSVLRVIEWAFGEDGTTPTEADEIAALRSYVDAVSEHLPAVRAWKTKERRLVRENLERLRKAAEKKSRAEAIKKRAEFGNDSLPNSDASEGDEAVVEKKRKPEEKKRPAAAAPPKKRKVEEKKTKRPSESAKRPKSREEKKTKLPERPEKEEDGEVIEVYNSEDSDDDREDVLKGLIKTASDFEERNRV